MKRKHLVAALSLLLLVAVVATGVHVLNREARADVTYSVQMTFVWGQGGDEFGPLTDSIIYMQFFDGENWTDWILAEEVDDGLYSVDQDVVAQAWNVKFIDSTVQPDDPEINPCAGPTNGYFEWFVIPI